MPSFKTNALTPLRGPGLPFGPFWGYSKVHQHLIKIHCQPRQSMSPLAMLRSMPRTHTTILLHIRSYVSLCVAEGAMEILFPPLVRAPLEPVQGTDLVLGRSTGTSTLQLPPPKQKHRSLSGHRCRAPTGHVALAFSDIQVCYQLSYCSVTGTDGGCASE